MTRDIVRGWFLRPEIAVAENTQLAISPRTAVMSPTAANGRIRDHSLVCPSEYQTIRFVFGST